MTASALALLGFCMTVSVFVSDSGTAHTWRSRAGDDARAAGLGWGGWRWGESPSGSIGLADPDCTRVAGVPTVADRSSRPENRSSGNGPLQQSPTHDEAMLLFIR